MVMVMSTSPRMDMSIRLSTRPASRNKWKYEDLGDDLPRWEVTPGGSVPDIPVFPFTPWKAFATAVTAAFRNHRITAGFLVDDSCSFLPAACGKAYYDLVTIENRTLEIWQDTVKPN
jgi:hypothetical protein